MVNLRVTRLSFHVIAALLLWLIVADTVRSAENDIRALSQHFGDPNGDIGTWRLVPPENVKEASTAEHPGLLTLWEAGKGKDVKGILGDPIRIDDYALPWEFQLSLMKNFDAIAGVGSKTQVNFAMGLNVAVTFSNPSTWPSERTQMPPDTRVVQLLVVHIGLTGEGGQGLPQFTDQQSPETYLVWGRGDLGYTAMGEWRIPHVTVMDGSRYAGPASDRLFFRCVLMGPSALSVGIKFDAAHGWNMRVIDLAQYGNITGIWEIGPVFSCDRWIPDVLCRSIGLRRGPGPMQLGDPSAGDPTKVWTVVPTPQPEPPNPDYEYYVDYCVFLGSTPIPFEQYSDDFEIPGYLAQWQIQPQCTVADTFSHPGQLAFTLLGPGSGTGFGAVGGGGLSLKDYPPPWEIEICFTPPPADQPWNFWMNWWLEDKDHTNIGRWQPGLKFDPKKDPHPVYTNLALGDENASKTFAVRFEPDVPSEILSARPVYLLLQVIDPTHVRVGLKAKKVDAWYLSKQFDCEPVMNGPLTLLGQHCWSTVNGRRWGSPPGAPAFQTYLIDYVHYRYGLSE
ncbi:MAG: hypothetical protein HUU46_12895 [Candidatus Hydrogenedentes bacterium]|nr:hypothetical protein [Candidatus Hydrogenedentota bacterium]